MAVAQCLALIPGSRAPGSTIVAGVVAGLKHAEAARFSFLMGAPIILAANVYEAPKLMKEGATLGPMAVLSGVVAGIVAYLSLAFLMRYFHKHEFEAMSPFAYYCWAAGADQPGDHRASSEPRRGLAAGSTPYISLGAGAESRRA